MRAAFWKWLVVASACGVVLTARGDEGADLWLWQDVTYWQNEQTRAHVFLFEAFEEASAPTILMVSPRLKHRPLPWLECGAGFSLLRLTRGVPGEGVFNQERPELELNPLCNLGPHWRLHFRNRAEVRWEEWQGEPRPRLRHRLQFTRNLNGVGPLQSVFFSNEWLIELDRGDWTENRWVPVGLSFRLTDKLGLDLFHMVRSFRQDDGWRHDQVAGVFLKVRL